MDGGLAFIGNDDMSRIALPELRKIAGGFQVINNSNLMALDELYSLETIEGAIDLEGAFDKYGQLHRCLVPYHADYFTV